MSKWLDETGCHKVTPVGLATAKPCPGHAVCSWVTSPFDREPYCPPDFTYRSPQTPRRPDAGGGALQPMVEPQQPAPQPGADVYVDPQTAQLDEWEFVKEAGVLKGKSSGDPTKRSEDGAAFTTARVLNADLHPPAQGVTVQTEDGTKYQLQHPVN